ncbi:MAG: nucleotidyltransferase domain-containing protein [Nanoarchaeota archaeon]|nr:nucleotidyltransferase domain-containing protein [Nanoarchaeota archaeon]
MVQKSSYERILEVFFKEPTEIHFIKEIGRKINLAHTSVRNNVKMLLDEKLIQIKKSKPFDGYIANRDSDKFLFLKRAYNFFSLYELKEKIISEIHPKAIVLFGSYLSGEDVEESDIDILIISKIKNNIDLKKFEKKLNRKINFLIVKKLEDLDKNIQKKILNGVVLHGVI